MASRWIPAMLMLGLLASLPFACRDQSQLPEPVGERPTSSSPDLPPNHPPVDSSRAPELPPSHSPVDPSAARPEGTTSGTRNPMEDIMAFKARLEKDPRDLEALVSLANANMMISRFDAAQGLYERAMAINPKDLDLRTNLAIAYKYGGKSEQALAALRKNLEIDPNNDSTLYNLGFLYYFDQKDPAKAREVWNKWLTLYPDAPAAAEVRQEMAKIDAETGGAKPGGGTTRAGRP